MADQGIESHFEPILELWEDSSPSSQARSPGPGLEARYRGVLLGAAVGNLLGIPVEGIGGKPLQLRFPQGVREIDPAERHRPWDDDVAQIAMLAEALLSGGSLDLEDLAGRFLQWANESGRGMGNLTRRVLQQLSRGVAATEAAKQVWEMDGRRSAGNGSVMRCSPVALRWRRRPQLLVQETLRSARVTHYDPRCQWSAVAVNVALAHSLEERPIELPALAAALDKAGAPDSVGDAVRFAAGHSLDELVLDDPRAMGYTLKAMQAGLWVSTQEDGFEEALIGVVSAGGDTDTNGAVAGAMLGGVFGDAGIPARWLQCVPDRGRLEDLAGQLLAACDASG